MTCQHSFQLVLKRKAAHKGAAFTHVVPNDVQTLALEGVLKGERRHGVRQLNERRIVYELVPANFVAMAQAARFNARQVPGHKTGSAVVLSLSEGQMNRGCFNANHVAQELPGHGSGEIL
jgi:hypothetical protein